ncbi:MarR family winged helix-turn-helix transcriptional regulator [Bradyrhizobium sp. OK095]|uniref:MarR family winged helix-turn-helix transcriptional regulator n=1 Tax=Bradyrhizobium sp. OK095 TaxID=1882760 RepID=UPI0008B6F90E|nr:MarR family winged helix-turn-helix transcriptional regulator [Bradyrhizobium sp. OK095]SEN77127.1 DNA-binding transcriptional regulator, MarR family [Bradyrhizobium sp. OK095]
MPKHTREGAAITELILSIFLTNGRIMRAGDALLSDLGLNGTRWQVLGAIKDAPKTVAQIARQYELSRQGVLWVVQSLLDEDLVRYVNNPDHKRAKLLMFTEKGRQTYDEVARRQRVWSNELGATFGVEDVKVAMQCIRRLGELVKSGNGADEE